MKRSSNTLTNLLAVYSFDPSGRRTGPVRPNMLAPTTLASVVLVSHNSREHLDGCLNSLLHTLGLNCEVIVVDNASTDGSADFVAEYFPWVRLVRGQAETSLAAALDKGVAFSSGRYLVVLGTEAEVTEGWLDALLAALDPSDAGITTPRVMRRGTEGEGASSVVPVPSSLCFALRRDLWDELGVSKSALSLATLLAELAQGVRAKGLACVQAKDALVYDRHKTPAEPQEDARRLCDAERERLLVLVKRYRRQPLVLSVPALLVLESVAWVEVWRKGRARVAAKQNAYRWLYANRDAIARRVRRSRGSKAATSTTLTGKLYEGLLEGPGQRVAGPLQALGRWRWAARSPGSPRRKMARKAA
jgi:glycosyltransferase involved in cell wall biosynthesis